MCYSARMSERAIEISAGALRAVAKLYGKGHGLYASAIGEDDAEELWFASMLNVMRGGERLVRRNVETMMLGSSLVYVYHLTEDGHELRRQVAVPA
jgi:hypothetical protein